MEEQLNLPTSLHLQGSNAESTTQPISVEEEPKLDNHHIHGDGGPVVAENMNSEIHDCETLAYGYCFCDLYSFIYSRYTYNGLIRVSFFFTDALTTVDGAEYGPPVVMRYLIVVIAIMRQRCFKK